MKIRAILCNLGVAACVTGFTWAASGQDATSSLVPTQLRCEESVNPLGIDQATPRLYWTLESKERGQRQSAYQIIVASSAELLAKGQGDLWDSGKITSNDSIHIRYAGKELKTAQQVFWKVRTWDKDGKVSAWSAPATWTMGVLNSKDWHAEWVCSQGATETLLLRKECDVKPGLVRAVAFVCGLGQYEMSLNGAKAGDDLLSPGWTDYHDTELYDTKDVTALLHEGRNAVGLTLGNGMYNVVRRNRFVKFTGSFGPLKAICQLRLEYSDGSTETVGTDDTWRTHAGPITFSSIYGGEDCDARLNPLGWDKAGFDDSAWRHAVKLVRPGGSLRGHSVAAPPLREIEVNKAVSVHPLDQKGTFVYDFGQNTAHIPRLRVTGPAGSTVRLLPSEILGDDGSINQRTMGAGSRGRFWWQYTKGTDGEETWSPKFCYIGCRYMEAELTPAKPGGELPHIESLDAVVVHSSAAPVGDFECSNDLLNRIRTLVRWAQRANMVSVLTDCPHREKLGWLEQYHLNGPSIRYEFDVSRIFTKGMHDMADSQSGNGLVPNIAPEYTVFGGTFRAAAEWGSAFVIVPWQQYEFDGDLDLLRAYYDRMKRYVGYLESISTNDIVSEGLGDWYDLGPNRPGFAQLTKPPLTATAFYYYDTWILSQVAALLGKPDEAKDYTTQAERIRESFNHTFYNASKGNYGTDSQCANALPLVLGIVAPEHREAVFSSLVSDVESRGYAMTAGDVGFRFLLQALALGGRSDVIYKMINQDDKPGYGYQLKKGATSLCEAWDANNSSSHDHFMLGQITEWFYKDLVGIQPDRTGAGFRKTIINPSPVGDLQWARATYDSIHGPIACGWKRDGDHFTLTVSIPANTTATVFVPASSADKVTESGKLAQQSNSVSFLRQEKDRAVFSVESGDYTFVSTL